MQIVTDLFQVDCQILLSTDFLQVVSKSCNHRNNRYNIYNKLFIPYLYCKVFITAYFCGCNQAGFQHADFWQLDEIDKFVAKNC